MRLQQRGEIVRAGLDHVRLCTPPALPVDSSPSLRAE